MDDIETQDAALADVEAARTKYNEAHRALYAAVRAALKAGHGPSAVGRAANWSREYVTRVRDGRTKS